MTGPSRNLLPIRTLDLLTVAVYETGSRVICNPPVLNTDHDFLVLVQGDRLDEAGIRLQGEGFENCLKASDDGTLTNDGYTMELAQGGRFQAWRREVLNLIVTDDTTFYLRSVGATMIAKHLNLLCKQDRIDLFRCMKYGEPYYGNVP